ncbi:hypothetical protein TNIN_462131 [Trichonephila inaurata madagascariensis]|uniref:CCHC-type domain-containing protein n=1 Tax=Trichonephila inaurata madagascariensis TaxID=2747483 RepID=A0A8X6WLZ5_9ARAC|nr:hypothetical protein TNIN_462131 [Trichonephila inaurata madagascariensis]
MKQSESFNRVPNVSNELGKRSQIHCYNCQQQGHKSYECKAKIRNSKPKNFHCTKVLKAPTTHTVQDLPPNPCKKKEKVNKDEIDVVKYRTRKDNVLKFSNISEMDSDNECTRCQIEVDDNSETKDWRKF